MRELTLNEVKELEFELLKHFKKLCEDNGLYYTLCGGTLLGAIRHKGFIPWDDDIDVLMPRPDYDKLLNQFNIDMTQMPEEYSLVTWKNGKFDYPFMKLVDERTVVNIPYLADSFQADSIWIDIFPIDGNPESNKDLKKLYKKSLFWRQVIRLKTANPHEGKNRLKKLIKPILVAIAKQFDSYTLCKKIDEISKTYSFTEEEKIGGVVWGYGPQERIDKDKYMRPVAVEFEGELFNAPSNYDEYLTNLYGNYMQLPAEDKRVTHEMKCYIK